MKNRRFSIYLLFLLGLLSLFSCVGTAPTKEMRLIDSLNRCAYAYRYKNLGSSYRPAIKAYNYARLYKQGKAEACNNLGFCAFMEMDFDRAERLHKEVYGLTKNELELLIADVGLMKIYQRTGMNKEYYDFRNSAIRRMRRIREDSNVFTDKHEMLRMNYAFTEFFIVSAVYYYYLQQRPEAIASLNRIPQNEALDTDTNQYLYFHYIKGSAALCESDTPDERKLCEFDELYTTWRIASKNGYLYFAGNGLQGLAELMTSNTDFDFFLSSRFHILKQFDMPLDTLLPLRLAEKALEIFREYDDLYQIAGTYVSIGKYLNSHGLYSEALDSLSKALDYVNYHHFTYYHSGVDTLDKLQPIVYSDSVSTERSWLGKEKVKTVPEWISKIREQLSVSYAGLGMKRESDYNRNIYLDILNDTRQDKELESRYAYLEAESKQLNIVLFFVIIGLILVSILFWIFNKRSKIKNHIYTERLQQTLALCRDITASIPMNVPLIQKGIDQLFGEGRVILDILETGKVEFITHNRLNRDEQALIHVLSPYIEWAIDNEQAIASLSDERNQLEKQRYVYEQHIAANKRQNLIKKSCLAIVNGINPFIDRILNEVYKLTEKGFIHNEPVKKEKYQYIDELVTTINEYNDILALWIKMKQGTLSLNIETFSLSELFNLLSKGRKAFEMKKQTLSIESTDILVKADKALTLFMINTLAENARKFTHEGGKICIYARQTNEYVEISIKDNGRGLSAEDIERIVSEKVYDSRVIGMNDSEDTEILRKSKGSGFGLMNCKGIIEKYRKTNDLFRVCTFNVESESGRGSRFYFRLPLGVRKIITILICLLLPATVFSSCNYEKEKEFVSTGQDSLIRAVDSEYDRLLHIASDYADAAYFSNIDGNYEVTLQYADSAIMLLNEHYKKYNPSPKLYMELIDEGIPAEISWWNEMFDTDYFIILDIRNEAAVAFLALKQINGYTYNNAAYTALYKLQSKDQSLEGYCRQLERSTTNKIVGVILCILLLVVALLGYYLIYIRKRLSNRLNLEQVLEINKKVFASSLIRSQESPDLLQREEDTLKEIPQRLVDEAFDTINELLTINCLSLAVYNETSHRLEFASNPRLDIMPDIMQSCFDEQKYITDDLMQAIPLIVNAGNERQCVGVLCLERREGSNLETDRLLFELVARYVSIVVFNAIVKLAMKFRDIESAYEETQRASWEDSMLHVQNMVLDNCLSTIKHETIYYPNKIKQIISRLNNQKLTESEELENIEAIRELIEYYKGIFTILSSCASRQLEEVTFRRTTIAVRDLTNYADRYFRKVNKGKVHVDFQIESIDAQIVGDINQLRFLLENLIDEALHVLEDGLLILRTVENNEYIRFIFTDTRRKKTIEELNQLFYPNLTRMTSSDKGELRGTEYLICKQIIRDHDEFAGRRGCRINAEPAENGGFSVYFTIPKR